MNTQEFSRILNRNSIDPKLLTEHNRFANLTYDIMTSHNDGLNEVMGKLIAIPTRTNEDSKLKDKLKDMIWKRLGI